MIKLTNGLEIRRHVDYVKKRDYVSESVDPAPDSRIESEMYGSDFNSSPQITEPVVEPPIDQPSADRNAKTSETVTSETSTTARRSFRERRPPQLFGQPILY